MQQIVQKKLLFHFAFCFLHLNRPLLDIKKQTNFVIFNHRKKYPIHKGQYKVNIANEAADYTNLLSQDPQLQQHSELWLSIRIYATRIMGIFIKTQQIIKMEPTLSDEFWEVLQHFQIAWRRGIMGSNVNELWQNAKLDEALAPTRNRWLRLVILYNQIRVLMNKEHLFLIEKVEDDVRNAKDQLVEEHANNMSRLSNFENVFSNYLHNSLFSGGNGVQKLQMFFQSKFHPNSYNYEKFLQKFPKIGPIQLRQNFEAEKSERIKEKYQMQLKKKMPLKFFEAFVDESFLYGKYAEFLSSPADDQLVLLDIGAYVNEIGQRIKMWEELQRINSKMFQTLDTFDQAINLSKVKKEWTEFLKVVPASEEELQKFEQKLHKMLCTILHFSENVKFCCENLAISMSKMVAQIHIKKFSLALCAKDQSSIGNIWEQNGNKWRDNFCKKLFRNSLGHLDFRNLILPSWKKMTVQIQQDVQIFNDLVPAVEQTNFLHPNFPNLSQQFNFDGENNSLRTSSLENANYVPKIEYENSEQYEFKLKSALTVIKKIVKKWSKSKASLLVTGSYFLNAHSSDSDIDLLCIVPEKFIQMSAFFGAYNTRCHKNVCSSKEGNLSFYCKICSNPQVTNLFKSTFGPVFLITFNLDGITFDLTYAAIPDIDQLPLLSTNDQNLENYIQKLWPFTDEKYQKMIRALSSHRSLLYITNVLLEDQNNGNWGKIMQNSVYSRKNQKTHFNQMFIAIKLWAQNNYIYSNKFGYLNGAMLTIMVTKIILLYPNASLPFLIEKFFLIYSTRPINLPLKLSPLDHFNGQISPFLGTSEEQEMPVYTPTFPQQNAGQLLTQSSAKVIRNEMINAFRTIKLEAENPEFNVNKLLHKTVPFNDRFAYFVLFNCVAEQNTHISNKFCRFVEGRIRRQNMFGLAPKNGPSIGTHLFPDIYQRNCEIPNKILSLAFKPTFCKVWLLGINAKVNNAKISPMLAQFDGTIKRDFLKYNTMEADDESIEVQNQKKIKMPNAEDANAKYEYFKLDIKSKLVKKWDLLME